MPVKIAMKSLRGLSIACAVAAMGLAAQAVAQELESARQYCEETQGYDLGSRDYTRCYATYVWAHCDGQGHKPGSAAHTACMKAMNK